MKFLAGYACGLAVACVIAALIVASSHSAKPAEPDYDAVATCMWERWDSSSSMTPVARFCYRFGPSLYGEKP